MHSSLATHARYVSALVALGAGTANSFRARPSPRVNRNARSAFGFLAIVRDPRHACSFAHSS